MGNPGVERVQRAGRSTIRSCWTKTARTSPSSRMSVDLTSGYMSWLSTAESYCSRPPGYILELVQVQYRGPDLELHRRSPLWSARAPR